MPASSSPPSLSTAIYLHIRFHRTTSVSLYLGHVAGEVGIDRGTVRDRLDRYGLGYTSQTTPSRPRARQVRSGLPAAAASAVSGARPQMRSAAFSASMMVGALMLPRTSTGITEASTTRSPWTPSTRS